MSVSEQMLRSKSAAHNIKRVWLSSCADESGLILCSPSPLLRGERKPRLCIAVLWQLSELPTAEHLSCACAGEVGAEGDGWGRWAAVSAGARPTEDRGRRDAGALCCKPGVSALPVAFPQTPLRIAPTAELALGCLPAPAQERRLSSPRLMLGSHRALLRRMRATPYQNAVPCSMWQTVA